MSRKGWVWWNAWAATHLESLCDVLQGDVSPAELPHQRRELVQLETAAAINIKSLQKTTPSKFAFWEGCGGV